MYRSYAVFPITLVNIKVNVRICKYIFFLFFNPPPFLRMGDYFFSVIELLVRGLLRFGKRFHKLAVVDRVRAVALVDIVDHYHSLLP